jgi:two-component system cell cycle response regulator CpdR
MGKILLVDDDGSMRHFLCNALQRAGHDVDICSDGREALHALHKKENSYDLLLTDVVMPGMDGIELSKRVAPLYPDLKIMFMTGFSAVLMDRKDINENSVVLSKPFHLNDLVKRIESILED